MQRSFLIIGAISSLFGGCASLDMPSIDFFDEPEFAVEAKDIKEFPNVSQAPTAPDDVRSAAQWDRDAKALMRLRDRLDTPDDAGDMRSNAEIRAEIDSLRAKVHAYKLDDPE